MSNCVYVNGIILDGTKDMQPKKGLAIVTRDDTIISITPIQFSTDYYVKKGYKVVDLQGRYIMPGLINMHVHLPASGRPKNKPTDAVKMVHMITSNAMMKAIGTKICAGYAKMELMSGVTTIRTVGGIADFDTKIRDQIASGKRTGPRILASNMAVSVEGGHMAGSLGIIVHSAQEARNCVIQIASEKPDLIKLMITGGVLDAKLKGEPGVLKMPAEYVKAACDQAHALGLKVAAHVESPEGVKVALENGVDTIEHGAKPDEEIIKLLKEKNACLITTLSPALSYALFDTAISHATELEQFNGNIVFQGIIECAKACLKNGIPVGLGTDTGCPYTTHYDMWRELYYYHKFCHVSNTFALYTATSLNAQIAGLGTVIGRISEGYQADFIVTDQNPLYDLRALRNITMVVTGGKIIKNPRVKKMPEVEKELDKIL